jgi:hypothetical protein
VSPRGAAAAPAPPTCVTCQVVAEPIGSAARWVRLTFRGSTVQACSVLCGQAALERLSPALAPHREQELPGLTA